MYSGWFNGSIEMGMLGGRRLAGVTILLLITLSSMGIVATGREVLIHDNGDYTVTYRDKLLPTRSHLTVSIDGAPRGSKMIVYSYILTPTGYKYYKSAWGAGKATIEVSGAIEEVAQGLRSLGWKGDSEGLSLLLLILYAEETRRGTVVESKMLNVPIIPGQAKGKDIAVTIQRNSLTTMTLEEGKTGISVEEPGIEEAPDVIPMLCIGSYPYATCYRWTLNQTLHEAYMGVPLQITRIDSVSDASNIKRITHQLLIFLEREYVDYINLNAAFAMEREPASLTIGSAGPTFTKHIDGGTSKEILIHLNCDIFNEYLTSDPSYCVYNNRTLSSVNGFEYFADIMTGIVANVGVSIYNLEVTTVWYGYPGPWVPIGNGTITWMIPVSDGNGKLLPWVYVDDWLGDGQGFDSITNTILESSTLVPIPGQYQGMMGIPSVYIEGQVQGNPKMALGIDVGAIIAAIASRYAGLPAGLLSLLPTLVVGIEYGSNSGFHQIAVYVYTAYSTNQQYAYNPVMYKTELPYQEFESNTMYEVPRSLIKP